MIDFAGGTYVSQFEVVDLPAAIAAYNDSDPSGQQAVPVAEPVPLAGMKGAYCATGHSAEGDLILATIVRTDV